MQSLRAYLLDIWNAGDWKKFLETLARPFEFLHADELKRLYSISGVPLPAIFEKEGEQLELLIDADSINACLTIADLKRLVTDKLKNLTSFSPTAPESNFS